MTYTPHSQDNQIQIEVEVKEVDGLLYIGFSEAINKLTNSYIISKKFFSAS